MKVRNVFISFLMLNVDMFNENRMTNKVFCLIYVLRSKTCWCHSFLPARFAIFSPTFLTKQPKISLLFILPVWKSILNKRPTIHVYLFLTLHLFKGWNTFFYHLELGLCVKRPDCQLISLGLIYHRDRVMIYI